jgi:hypothetical protein
MKIRHLFIGALAAVSLCLTGCGLNPVERTQAHAYGSGTLHEAYAQLLETPVWEKIKIDKTRFVHVRGNMNSTGQLLEVYYEHDVTPPKMQYFVVDGERSESDKFAEFISDYFILAQIQ